MTNEPPLENTKMVELIAMVEIRATKDTRWDSANGLLQ